MTDEKTRALIAALRANVELAAHGTPPTMAARILAGESDDDRLALMVQAADALEALTVPDGDARERIAEIVYAKVEYRGDINYVSGEDKDSEQYLYCQNAADAILAAFPVLSGVCEHQNENYLRMMRERDEAIAALSRAAAPEPEWEYGTAHADDPQAVDMGYSLEGARRRVAQWNASDPERKGIVVRAPKRAWEPLPVGGGGA